ncbi:MAG: TonB family protein [Pyrinomonadaceae bacterium]|nr:TonB family protein [Pyrinomonadaceae bacterium]
MFDNLVESSSNPRENARQAGYLGITTVLLVSLFASMFIWSLYSINLEGMVGDGDMSLGTLVAPVPVPDAAPPPPTPPTPQASKPQPTEKQENVVTRTENIQRVGETPKIPDTASSKASNAVSRPDGAFKLGDKNTTVTGSGPVGPTTGSNPGSGTPILPQKPQQVETEKDDPPPPPTPKPTPKPTPTPAPKQIGPISGGVVNGKARNLVTPPYPPQAKAVRASGQVSVQVLIDESGNVVSATAVSGNPLLRAAAAQAARASKFSPTLLSGQPVKVSGTIIYNFTAQ